MRQTSDRPTTQSSERYVLRRRGADLIIRDTTTGWVAYVTPESDESRRLMKRTLRALNSGAITPR